ncbi:MAG: efflux RND transporter periplasmic adaptor subunit, partial [Paracoccaceae bacterium]
MKRKWLLPILAVTLGGVGYLAWARSAVEDTIQAPATVTVERGTVERTVLASGVIEAGSLISVGARVSGQIETLAVGLGDRVKAGDLIAQIESLEQQNDVLQAEADLAQIEAQAVAKRASLREAELALDRKRQLNQKSLATAEELEAAEAALAVIEAEIAALDAQRKRAEVAVGSARLALERTRITAPADGTVVAVVTAQGQTVNAASDAPVIVKIADLSAMVVKAEISEADVVRVEAGQRASLTLLGEPDNRIDAVLRAVEPAPPSIKESDEVPTDEA